MILTKAREMTERKSSFSLNRKDPKEKTPVALLKREIQKEVIRVGDEKQKTGRFMEGTRERRTKVRKREPDKKKRMNG